MPLPLQAKMLRALQDGEIRRVGENRAFAVDVRIVCATHRDLAERVRLGTFREDLYFRLKVLSVTVPPLRERVADILPLARQFLAAERHAPPGFTTSAEERLLAHHWPGNVRELENVVRHGAALAGAARAIDGDDLPDDVAAPRHAPVSGPLRPLAEIERDHVLRVLDACGGSQTDAARILGIARNTLWRKLKGYA
jgi:two-component system response regulator HydG